MAQVECPSCKMKIDPGASFTGQSIACPKCRAAVPVPTQPGATSGPPPFRNVVLLFAGLAVIVFIVMWSVMGGSGPSDSMKVVDEISKVATFKTSGMHRQDAFSDAPLQQVVIKSIRRLDGPDPVVVINTTLGPITVQLFPDKSPITVANFLKYVDAKHYNGTIFHRVIARFMIQGGGFDAETKEPRRCGAPIKNEAGNGLSNARGTIAMARTNDPDSATDQFYINVVDNKALDRSPTNPGYTVFGRVLANDIIASHENK